MERISSPGGISQGGFRLFLHTLLKLNTIKLIFGFSAVFVHRSDQIEMSRRKQPQKRPNKKPNGQNNSEFTIETVAEPNNVSIPSAGHPAAKQDEDDEILILDAKLDSLGLARKQMPKDGACLVSFYRIFENTKECKNWMWREN